jgi:hypothetical protein
MQKGGKIFIGLAVALVAAYFIFRKAPTSVAPTPQPIPTPPSPTPIVPVVPPMPKKLPNCSKGVTPQPLTLDKITAEKDILGDDAIGINFTIKDCLGSEVFVESSTDKIKWYQISPVAVHTGSTSPIIVAKPSGTSYYRVISMNQGMTNIVSSAPSNIVKYN